MLLRRKYGARSNRSKGFGRIFRTKKEWKMKKALVPKKLLPLALLVFLIIGCQGVFTFAPFGFLSDDPAKMSKDQLVNYGFDVIATGDSAKITAALNATKSLLVKTPADKDLNYLAANLCLTLSKATALITNQPKNPAEITAFLASLNVPDLEAAGTYYAVADANLAKLNAVDYIFATLGLLLPTTADDPVQLGLINFPGPLPPATPITPAQTAIFTNYYAKGIALLGGPGCPWDVAIRTICFPFAP
jgi:hypothetical protein